MSKSSRSSEYRLKRRVQFHETDAAGIVHFSCFFRYMEEAEHALWREAGLSIARGHAEVGFPRVSANFDYHRPLRFEDEIDVSIRIVAIDDKTMRYSCVIMRDEEKIATGTMTIICIARRPGLPMKAASIPPDIASRFEVAADALV